MHALDALGNPVRRAILHELRAGPLSVGEIAAGLPVSRPAVSRTCASWRMPDLCRPARTAPETSTRFGCKVLPTSGSSSTSSGTRRWPASRSLPGDDGQVGDAAAWPPAAFALFTEKIGEWWPPDRRHTEDPASEIFILESGRFYERARDGHEVELGCVRSWELPRRILLDFFIATGPENPTEVEITFAAEEAAPA